MLWVQATRALAFSYQPRRPTNEHYSRRALALRAERDRLAFYYYYWWEENMSSNGGGGACFEPRSFDHCEHMMSESRKAKAKEDKRFCACARACKIRCVRMCVDFRNHRIIIITKHNTTTMESLSPLTPLGSSSAHPPTKKQRKEGMNTLL